MATSGTLKLKSLVKDITRCPICLDYCVDPRSLPCLHTFCLECMEGHCRDKCPEDDAECPVCRREFQIPESGVKGLPHNFFVADLVSMRKVTSTMQDNNSAETERCGVCADETGNKAKVYCVDCQEKLCDHCSIRCRKSKGGAHQLENICDENTAKSTLQRRGLYCEEHCDEKLEKYCTECSVNICSACNVNHVSHRLTEISVAAVELKRQFEEHLATLSNVMITFKKKRQSIEEAIEKNSIYAEVVYGKVKLAHRPADKPESEKDLLARLESIDLALVALESFINYGTELLSKGTPLDITRAADSLKTRANELLSMATNVLDECSPTKNRPKRGGIVKYFRNLFVRSSVETSEMAHIHEGNSTNESTSYEEANLPSFVCDCEARPVYSNSALTGIRGIAYCDNKLFIVCKQSDIMFVSQLGSGLFTPVRIKGLADPCEIVASSEKHLFIGDCRLSGICRVSLDGQIERWMSTKPVRPRSLSIKSSQVCMTTAKENELFLYEFKDNRVKKVSLIEGAVILHAVETFDETFIVSHLQQQQPKISEVNVDGQTIREYSDKQVAIAAYLSLDADGRVLVAEYKNCRVLLLNRHLELQRVILDDEKEALVTPDKMCYIAQTGQLIVFNEECIEVFDISQVMLCTHCRTR